MTLDEAIQGFEILRKYTKSAFPLGAEHDQIFFSIDAEAEVSDEDKKKLAELHWFYDTYIDCWSAFV